jgi:GPH family glycoside/pentoside/hexuronide:cation symporter
LMGVQNFIGQTAYIIATWFLLFMQNERFFDDMVEGAAGRAIIIAAVVIVVGILPAVFLRERLKSVAVAEAQQKHRMTDGFGTVVMKNLADFFRGFLITLKFTPFLKLCIATFLVFNGFMLVSSFQFYVIIYYVFGGDTVRGAEYAGYAGTVGAISTFCVIVFVTWLGTRIGKRRAFFVTIGVSMVGYALKWICYDPEVPWLLLVPAPLLAFGLGGLFTIMPSMIADVVDVDELNTHERREGMYGSIFWWVVKLGMAAALAAGGFLLNATGFDVALEGNQSDHAIFLMRVFDAFVPFVASGIAIWAIATFPITEESAHQVRLQLEARRGKV